MIPNSNPAGALGTRPISESDAAGSFPSIASAWQRFAILGAVALLTTADRALLLLLQEPVKLSFGLTDFQLGVLQGPATGLPLAFAVVLAGYVADRGKRVLILAAATLVWGGCLVGIALAQNYSALLISKIAMNVALAFVTPVCLSIISDLFHPSKRALVIGFYVACQAAGDGLGMVIGGQVYKALSVPGAGWGILTTLEPWRDVMLAYAAPALLVSVLFIVSREPQRREREGGRAEQPRGVLQILARYRTFMLALAVGISACGVASLGATAWAAPMLMRTFGLKVSDFSTWFGLIHMTSVFTGGILAGPLSILSRRYASITGAVLIPGVGAALLHIPASTLGLWPSIPIFMTLLALLTFSMCLLNATVFAAVVVYLPNEVRGLAVGCVAMLLALVGMSVGPMAVAVVSETLGGAGHLGSATAAVGILGSMVGVIALLWAMSIAPAYSAPSQLTFATKRVPLAHGGGDMHCQPPNSKKSKVKRMSGERA